MTTSTDSRKTGIARADLGSVTFASVASKAAQYNGYTAFISDWGSSGTMAFSNGSRWLPIAGRALLKHLGSASSNIGSTPTIVLQTPANVAGLIQVGDMIVFDMPGMIKSGTTDTGSWNIYAGTAGTTSDTGVITTNNQALAAANQSVGVMTGLKIVSNTSVQRVGSASGGWQAASTVAAAAPVTISDLSANSLIFSFAIFSGGTTNTVAMQEGAIWHVAS
jgi:hypothetical protein